MSNVHGLFSNRNNDDDSSDEETNNRYVGGVDGRGGGRYEPKSCVGRTSSTAFLLLAHTLRELFVLVRSNYILVDWP
jgi:hypothetical protein